MTAHTPASFQLRPSGLGVEFDGLMTAVSAGDIAPPAADAGFAVKNREKDLVSLQALMVYYGAAGPAGQKPDARNAFDLHILREAFYEIFDDPVTVSHDSGSHLYAAGSQEDKYRRRPFLPRKKCIFFVEICILCRI